MNICVYGSANDRIDPSYLTAGEQVGEILARHGHGMVFGGGAHGMMGAAARGVHRAGGKIIGVCPRFFDKEGVLFQNCTEFIFTETMRERKQIMEDRSDAFLVTPGGIGTYDEMIEILSLRQLKRHFKPILVLNVNGYFDPLLEMLTKTAEQRFMKSQVLSLLLVETNPEQAIIRLEEAMTAEPDQNEYR